MLFSHNVVNMVFIPLFKATYVVFSAEFAISLACMYIATMLKMAECPSDSVSETEMSFLIGQLLANWCC